MTDRLQTTKTSDVMIAGKVVHGYFRRLNIESFPENVSKIRIYARAWGHRNGDPGNEPSGFFDKLVNDINNSIDNVLPFTTKSQDRPGFHAPPRAQAYMDVWINGEVVPPALLKPNFRPLYDQIFDNYNLYFDDENWPLPTPGQPFEFIVSHGNNIADCDGFEAFIELTMI